MPPTDAYLEARVLTASREQLHLMVLDGAMRHCFAAEDALACGDREAKWQNLSQARQHVSELLGGMAAVDDEFVDNLRGLFKFVLAQLTLADTDEDAKILKSAMRILELHRETWVSVMDAVGASR